MGIIFWISMFVLSLCNQLCPDKLPVQPDLRLGEGADGEVLTIIGSKDKVLKLGVLYEHVDYKLKKRFNQIERVLKRMITYPTQSYVRVYEYGYLGTFSRKNVSWNNGTQEFILYYYTMEKLEKITDDERRVFHSILSHEDRGIEKNFSTDKIKEMLEGMSRGLDFDAEKIILFCNNIRNATILHLDIHVRNIMKDENGNFKLIDLDRVKLEKE